MRQFRTPAFAVALLAILLLCLNPSVAQIPQTEPGYLSLSIQAERTFQFVGLAEGTIGPDRSPLPKDAIFNFRITDNSATGNTPVGSNDPEYHILAIKADWAGGIAPGPGWQFTLAGDGNPNMQPGRVYETYIQIQHEATTIVRDVAVNIVANLTARDDRSQSVEINETFHVRIYPTPGIQVFVLRTPDKPVGPNQFVTIPVSVLNTDLYPHQIELTLEISAGEGVDPATIPVTGHGIYFFEPLEERFFNLSFRTPKDKFYYSSTGVQYTVRAVNDQYTGISQTQGGVVIVEGFYFNRQFLLIIPVIIILLALLIFLLLKAKRYYDERVVGKPIPPWRIPEEAAHLETLRRNDPREFYLRRHFFMEEEYQSALNWFYSFKKRSKRQIAAATAAEKYEQKAAALADPSLVRFDRRAERLTRRYRARQEHQRLKLEAKLEKLQTKVDQHHEEDFDKDHAKWEKKVEKLKKKANKPWFKAHKKWDAEVAKINREWEKPFRKEKEQADKARTKALAKYEKQVKKKDKQTWRDWREAVENAERENKVRKKEGREPTPLPELFSQEVGPPELPPEFKTPPRPKLPPEPKEPTDLELPPEPKLAAPKLEESHYAGKARRATKKTDRKVRRLERKLERALAKNERDRVRRLAKADRKRSKLIDKRRHAFEPSLVARILRQTPEHREYRARRKLMKALAKEKVKQVEESEKSRLEVMRVDAERREAELLSRLIRDRAGTVRSGAASSGMRMAPDKDPSLVALRAKNQAQLERERSASQAKLKAEEARIEQELRAGLTEELIKERARSRPSAAATKQPAKPKKA